MMTQEGYNHNMEFQVCDVTRPLGSVFRICEAGHVVVFDKEGSFILNNENCEINWRREENENYLLDSWVNIWVEYKECIPPLF